MTQRRRRTQELSTRLSQKRNRQKKSITELIDNNQYKLTKIASEAVHIYIEYLTE